MLIGCEKNAMIEQGLYAKPAHLIRRAHQIAWAIFLEECGEFNLTPVQYATLYVIGLYPGVDATRLSSIIDFDRSTIGNVLERLEKRGLISRFVNKGDRRLKIVELSDSGTELIRKVEGRVERVQTRLLEPLSVGEQGIFMELLKKITDNNYSNY